jgi:hypothetical protein
MLERGDGQIQEDRDCLRDQIGEMLVNRT